MASPAGPFTGDAIAGQLGAAYDRFGEDERSRHIELLCSLRTPADVVLHAEGGSGHQWTVTVCTTDCLGALAVIAGLAAA